MDAIIFIVLLVGCCGYAMLKGGWPEKIAALLLTLAAVASFLTSDNDRVRAYSDVAFGIMTVDALLLIVLMLLALIANRYWPMWLTSMQIVTLMSHVAFGTIAARAPWAYAIATTFWGYPMVAVLAVATRRHLTRQKKWGEDPAWCL